jgi:hypothetical protein
MRRQPRIVALAAVLQPPGRCGHPPFRRRSMLPGECGGSTRHSTPHVACTDRYTWMTNTVRSRLLRETSWRSDRVRLLQKSSDGCRRKITGRSVPHAFERCISDAGDLLSCLVSFGFASGLDSKRRQGCLPEHIDEDSLPWRLQCESCSPAAADSSERTLPTVFFTFACLLPAGTAGSFRATRRIVVLR